MSLFAGRSARLWVAMLFATLAQFVYADAMRIGPARPDILLATAILCALFRDGNGGAALGFYAGLLHAAMTSPPHGGFGSLIVSRTLVCFGVGWLEDRIFRDNILIATAFVGAGTALAEILFFLFAPQPNVGLWARALGFTTLYNLLLAIPLYLILRRFLRVRAEMT